ncbi:cupin domain-containing protein [Deinococcus aquatilis]|jgi:mannose-6-phosphate isomerase-like protein (cupin superfamily)|uniref:cupin domain-containing protein n=1 Tax=Deinococcus aquatilis TaxID=519440 RepID=UPI0003682F30|nr:cupin domain-containing protein [Deinococcus aquatilis]
MTSEAQGELIAPDGGKALVNPVGGHMVLKLPSALTGGAYTVHDNRMPPGSPGPRPHIHQRHDETFYVLGGELRVRVNDQIFDALAGAFVFVPRGAVHQPSNPGAQPAHFLLLFSPGGMDRFFEEAAAGRLPLQGFSDDPDTLARLDEFCRRYGYEFAEFAAS